MKTMYCFVWLLLCVSLHTSFAITPISIHDKERDSYFENMFKPPPEHLRVPEKWRYDDSGYAQLASVRYTLPSAVPVPAWPPLPIAKTAKIVDVCDTRSKNGSFLILTDTPMVYECSMPKFGSNDTGLPPLPLSCHEDKAFSRSLPAGAGRILMLRNVPNTYAFAIKGHLAIAKFSVFFNDSALDIGNINMIAVDESNLLWVASDASNAVHTFDLNTPTLTRKDFVPPYIDSTCVPMSVGADADVAIGYKCDGYAALVRVSDARGTPRYRHQWSPGVIDTVPSDFAYDSEGSLWFSDDVVHRQVARSNGFWVERYGAADGLPIGDTTSIDVSALGNVYVGTSTGVLRYGTLALGESDKRNTQKRSWKLLRGGRWLPGGRVPHNQVLSLELTPGAVKGPHGKALLEATVVVTDGGLAYIYAEQWTLKEKAAHIQSMIAPRHLRFGYVTDAHLHAFADVSQWRDETTDNDGLHTSAYVISQSYAHAVSGDAQAHQRGIDALNALEFLNKVTNVKGLAARRVLAGPNGRSALNTVSYVTGLVARSVLKFPKVDQSGVCVNNNENGAAARGDEDADLAGQIGGGIGGTLAVIGVIAALILLVLFLRRRDRQRNNNDMEDGAPMSHLRTSKSIGTLPTMDSRANSGRPHGAAPRRGATLQPPRAQHFYGDEEGEEDNGTELYPAPPRPAQGRGGGGGAAQRARTERAPDSSRSVGSNGRGTGNVRGGTGAMALMYAQGLPDDPMEWSIDDVAVWVTNIFPNETGDELADEFERQRIDGDIFVHDLDRGLLNELTGGVYGHTSRLLRARRALLEAKGYE